MKLLSVVLMVVLLLSGPLASLAWAQEKIEGQMAAPAAERRDGIWAFGAAVVNLFYIPGKVILCGAGVATGLVLLGATFGTQYGTAARAGEEGCGGPWAVSAADLRPAPAEESIFYTERPGYKQSDYQKTE